MSVARVGAATYTFVPTGTHNATLPQSPTAGNLLVMGVIMHASSLPLTCGTPAGWTAGPTGSSAAGAGIYTTIFLFWKVASGGDTAPSMVTSYNAGVLIEEWSGLSATPHDVDSTIGYNSQGSTAAGTCNSGPLATTNATDWIWTFLGANENTPARTLTWGGGSTVDALIDATSANANEFGTATQLVSSVGTYTPTLAFASGTGTWDSSATASMAFKQANSAPNAPTLNFPTTIDRSIINRLPWTFSDPDAGDTQSKFDLQYQLIGAGSWTTITVTTANNYWDAPASIFAPGLSDVQVRTYDTSGAVGPWSASSRITTKSIGWGLPL